MTVVPPRRTTLAIHVYLLEMQAKEDATDLKHQSVALKDKLAETEAHVKVAADERDHAIAPIGNLVHDSVPIDDDEVCDPQCNGRGREQPVSQIRVCLCPSCTVCMSHCENAAQKQIAFAAWLEGGRSNFHGVLLGD